MSDTTGGRLARALQDSTDLAERTVAGLGSAEPEHLLPEVRRLPAATVVG